MDKPIPKEIMDRLEWKKSLVEQDDPVIKSIRHDPKPCEDCGKIVEDRRIRSSVNYGSATKIAHIKHQCKSCGFYRNPTNGVYEWTFQEINSHFYRQKRAKR